MSVCLFVFYVLKIFFHLKHTLSSVGHGEGSSLVLDLEVLVLKLGAVDRLSSGAVVVGEVSSLDHEVLDDTVEGRSLVSESLAALGKLKEVGRRLRHIVSEEANDDTASGLVTNGHVEVHLVGDLVLLLGHSRSHTGTENSEGAHFVFYICYCV